MNQASCDVARMTLQGGNHFLQSVVPTLLYGLSFDGEQHEMYGLTVASTIARISLQRRILYPPNIYAHC